MKRIRKYFITGILVLMPLMITLYLLWLAYSFINAVLGKAISNLISYLFGISIPGLGLLSTIIFIFLVGIFATNVLGRSIIDFGDKTISRIPLVRSI
jgi:uncharacterized membrane protein